MKQTVDWHSYWVRDKPGFHEGQVNAYLQRYLPLFNLAPGDTIFMPLCGKAVDILWLAQQGYRVIGVEFSAVAIEAFFAESKLSYEKSTSEHFSCYQSSNITLYQGDFMHLQKQQLADCRLIYDRASIVAIESFNRAAYVEQLLNINPKSVPILLVTLDYDQNVMQGPPFSVPVSEISALFRTSYRVELLESREQIDERPGWRAKGLNSLLESALRLEAL